MTVTAKSDVMPPPREEHEILARILRWPALMCGNHPVAERIAHLIALPLDDMGYELVRVRFDSGAHLQIMAQAKDSESLTLDDCQSISHALSAILDVEDPIAGRCRLEVSSPGIDRPLTRDGDFAAHLGAQIKAECRESIDGKRRIIGFLRRFEDDCLEVVSSEAEDESQTYVLPIAGLKSVKLRLTDALLVKTRETQETF